MSEQPSANLEHSDFAVGIIIQEVLDFLDASLISSPQGDGRVGEEQGKIQNLIKDTLLLAAQNPDATKKAVQRMCNQK